MDNYFMLDGKKIPMSDETAKSLRRKQCPPFDETVDAVRVSSWLGDGGKYCGSYPVRISILGDKTYGSPKGDYESSGSRPGQILTRDNARKLATAIQDCIKHREG